MKSHLLPHREKTPFSIKKISLEIIAVCSENPTKHVLYVHCVRISARFLSIAAGDPSSYHRL